MEHALAELGSAERVLIGVSTMRRGVEEGDRSLREAADAAHIARALMRGGGALAYAELGAYKYLVRLPLDEAPHDRHCEAVERLVEYDRKRRSQLVATLEQYLRDRRSIATTARALYIHPNTLRQRMDRIEKLAGPRPRQRGPALARARREARPAAVGGAGREVAPARPAPPSAAGQSRSVSSGNGGRASGRTAMRMSASGLSSPATRFTLTAEQPPQRWTSAHSPSSRTWTAIGSMAPAHAAARSPGTTASRCTLHRHVGQWLRWLVPGASPGTSSRQCRQRNESAPGRRERLR